MADYWTIVAALEAAEKDDPMAYAEYRREEAEDRSGSEWSMWNSIIHAMKMKEAGPLASHYNGGNPHD